jgi:hypothetical protein
MSSPSIDGAPMKCAHCQRPLPIQDNRVEAWRGRSDQLYCSELYSENTEQTAPQFSRRCDFCRGSLGLVVHQYYRMHFCCEAHMRAYRQRLTEETQAKIRRLSRSDRGMTAANLGAS